MTQKIPFLEAAVLEALEAQVVGRAPEIIGDRNHKFIFITAAQFLNCVAVLN